MPLLLDVYNILHVTGVLPPDLAGLDVEGLLELIGRSRYNREPAILVCDGNPPRDARWNLRAPSQVRPKSAKAGVRPSQEFDFSDPRVIYSGPHESADDVIVRMIAHSSAPRRLTVVSSDNEILRAVRKRRCPTLTAEVFLENLAKDHATRRTRKTSRAGSKPRAPLTASSIDEGIALFGLTERDLRIPPSRSKPTFDERGLRGPDI